MIASWCSCTQYISISPVFRCRMNCSSVKVFWSRASPTYRSLVSRRSKSNGRTAGQGCRHRSGRQLSFLLLCQPAPPQKCALPLSPAQAYHKIFTIPAVAIRCRAEFIRTILKTILNRPLAVFGNGHRFAFCKAAQRGQQELPFHFAGVQVFFFKIDGDVQFHQPAHQFQTICSVPRKPTD